jgi:hypothetical protein
MGGILLPNEALWTAIRRRAPANAADTEFIASLDVAQFEGLVSMRDPPIPEHATHKLADDQQFSRP